MAGQHLSMRPGARRARPVWKVGSQHAGFDAGVQNIFELAGAELETRSARPARREPAAPRTGEGPLRVSTPSPLPARGAPTLAQVPSKAAEPFAPSSCTGSSEPDTKVCTRTRCKTITFEARKPSHCNPSASILLCNAHRPRLPCLRGSGLRLRAHPAEPRPRGPEAHRPCVLCTGQRGPAALCGPPRSEGWLRDEGFVAGGKSVRARPPTAMSQARAGSVVGPVRAHRTRGATACTCRRAGLRETCRWGGQA